MLDIKKPYLLFLGDAQDQLTAKVALGIKQWRPEYCIGQYRMADCRVDCDLPDMDIKMASAAGVQTLIVGIANRGGIISQKWISVLKDALESGIDIASGLHNKLSDVTELSKLAAKLDRKLFDVRHPTETCLLANGRKRCGKRLLTVGTDCSCGKMFTALAIEKEILTRGGNCTFRATGQTGILISGAGVSIDAVVSDFVAGAVETLTPNNDTNHWDIIEGQGSLCHPSFAAVTIGIIHGAQPDALVLCHEPTRKIMRGVDYPIPNLADCLALNLSMAKLTNPNARFVGIAVNTSALDEDNAFSLLKEIESKFGIPAVDPVRHGVERIVDQLIDL